jgi:hypothetical protein
MSHCRMHINLHLFSWHGGTVARRHVHQRAGGEAAAEFRAAAQQPPRALINFLSLSIPRMGFALRRHGGGPSLRPLQRRPCRAVCALQCDQVVVPQGIMSCGGQQRGHIALPDGALSIA